MKIFRTSIVSGVTTHRDIKINGRQIYTLMYGDIKDKKYLLKEELSEVYYEDVMFLLIGLQNNECEDFDKSDSFDSIAEDLYPTLDERRY